MSTVDKSLFSTSSEDTVWDAIVIGSGMGGMTTAALLSKLGRRVLVLEQHYVPGGFTHSFRRKRWEWDVGVHAIGEVGPRSLLGRVLGELTDHRLAWSSLGSVYEEFQFPDLRLDFPDNREQLVANLKAAFPTAAHSRSIDAYLSETRRVSSAMRQYYLSRLLPNAVAPLTDRLLASEAHRHLNRITGDVMRQLTNDAKLATVLTAQWGYYGSPPERSSFAIQALVARHFLHGGYYPTGGAARIAESLLGTVQRAGGWTRIRADVSALVLDQGRVTGVELKSGERLRARRVVSAIGPLPTVDKLLPEAERARPWARSIQALRPSPAHVCLYLGLKGDPRQAGASGANKWFYESWTDSTRPWQVPLDGPIPDAPVLYTSFPSLKDPTHDPGPEQLHTGEVVTFISPELFAAWRDQRWQRRDEDYEALKQRITERLLDQLCRHMPGLRPLIAHAELSTPLSTEHFTRSAGGGIYGLEPVPARYQTRALRPRTPLPGLFLSGGDMASVGVMGAMVGGLLCAAAMEPLDAIRYLKRAAAPDADAGRSRAREPLPAA